MKAIFLKELDIEQELRDHGVVDECIDACWPTQECVDCYVANDKDGEMCEDVCDFTLCDMCMDEVMGGDDRHGDDRHGDDRHGDDMDLERELRDAGVTDECMDDCMPSEMCMDCYMNLDWENDPCMDLDDEDMEMCYEMMDDPCEDMCDWDMCEDCMVMGMVEDGMRDMGVPEECMDVCMPDEDCMDCMMAVDWDNMEDPCEDLDLEGEDLLDCYMDANPCMDACPTAACDECWDGDAAPLRMGGDDHHGDDHHGKGNKGGKGDHKDFKKVALKSYLKK